jgi:beta-lactamase superfamily II metal-dependent hydrolase
MRKLAVFNVGGALSMYLEFDDKKIVIDLGSGNGFSPVDDFLLPVASARCLARNKEGRYVVDQLFLSHLDRDHVSDYEKFNNAFFPYWMTCPNDNVNINTRGERQEDGFRINIELFGNNSPVREKILTDMRSRQPLSRDFPLGSRCENVKLFFIKPEECEINELLRSGYANNISLVLLIQVGDKNVLLPGDLLKEGMEHILQTNVKLREILNRSGIDYLIAPHHGLRTSFSEELFRQMRGGRTRLNIISEKIREDGSEENRSGVDTRCYSSDYSSGENMLGQRAVKTSVGHIILDFDTPEVEVLVVKEKGDLIREFIR